MRFLLDMGISRRLVSWLEAEGHTALHLHDVGLDHLKDPEILDKARREDSVLLTHDLDFAELVAASGGRLPSVVLFRLRDMRPASVEHYLVRVIRDCSEALGRGAIISVDERALRVRSLPIESEG